LRMQRPETHAIARIENAKKLVVRSRTGDEWRRTRRRKR
jgi:hypothetical protein